LRGMLAQRGQAASPSQIEPSSGLIGASEAIRRVQKTIGLAADGNATVLILGETGTGKELVARLVHSLDPARSQRELVVVDCTTLTPELSGSELFGHERGAYTGAVTGRDGAFALADGGTVFLDEVGELPLMLQAQLLRAVQEGTYKRVGGNDWRRVDFRLLCATNRDLLHDVERGTFRRDLYYRIAGCVVHTPPLRERREDVLPLVRHFLREHGGETAPVLSPAVQAYLLEREFPGNVRDLGQLVGRIAQRHAGVGPITLGDIPPEDRPLVPSGRHRAGLGLDAWIAEALASGMGLREIRRQVEKLVLRAAEGGSGTLREAAAKLGLSERALQMRRASARDDAPVACGPETLDA
jgi:transcriptional regulator with GAF, ATPase, and Fis domain